MNQMQEAFAKIVPDTVACWQALTDEERTMELEAAGFQQPQAPELVEEAR